MDLTTISSTVEPICKAANIKKLWVFGSIARGEESSSSDIDLIVRFGKPVGYIEFFNIEQELQSAIGRRVDLGTEASLHPLIKARVKREMRTIYDG